MFGDGGVFSLYTAGLANTLQSDVLLTLLAGTVIGVIFGVIPGLSATIGVAIFTPLTFTMSTESAFALLLGIYCGSTYGGSISAILVNIPGTISSVMTVNDGYPLTLKGEAGRAIGLATTSSFLGGIISVILLAFFAPVIAAMAIRLSAHEYFAVCLFGISVIAYVSQGTMLKGFIAGTIGFLLSTIGMESIQAFPRFTFGSTELLNGLEMIPLMVGVFGFAEVLRMAEKGSAGYTRVKEFGRVLPSLWEMVKLSSTLVRGSAIGVFIGAVPATGGTIAAIISYGLEKRISKHPETFGRGEYRGIVGPESANNAASGGAMIPMLTLGIPGDVVTAILIGALILHGLTPGPLLFTNNPEVVSSIFISMALANFAFLGMGLLAAKYFARVISLPRPMLLTMILTLAIVGTYAIRNSLFDVWVLVFSGIGGFFLTKVGIPVAPLVLGFILGPMIEKYLRQALMLSFGNPMDFILRPICATFLGLTLLVIVSPYLVKKLFRTKPELG